VKTFARGAKSFCLACKPVFEKVLAEAKAPPPADARCTLCKRPAADPGALNFGAEVVCASCTRVADMLVEYHVRERRAKRFRIDRRPLVVAGVVVAALVGLGASVVHAHQARSEESVVVRAAPSAPPSQERVEEASRRVQGTPTSYAEAVADLDAVNKLAEELKDLPECEPRLAVVRARARERRDAYAPQLAARAQADAVAAFGAGADERDAQNAKAALATFPAELAETAPAQDVRAARERYDAFEACARKAAALPHEGLPLANEAASLLRSREAAACELATTGLGRMLEDEVRRIPIIEKERAAREASAAAVAEGSAAEAKHDFARAAEIYRKAAAREPDAPPASPAVLGGLARALLEQGNLAAAREAADRALAADGTTSEARVLAAWLAYTDADPDGHARAAKALEGLSPADLGPLGRRLSALLALGAPRLEGRSLRVYDREALTNDRRDAISAAELALERTATILDVPVEARRVTLVFVPQAKLHALWNRLELSDGTPRAIFGALVPSDAGAVDVRRFAVASLVSRAPGAPAWVRAGLPDAFSSATASPAPAAASLKALEGLPEERIERDPDLHAAAARFASIAAQPMGARALRAYVLGCRTDPVAARAALEQELAKLAR
jgi:hypothetical protein